MYVPVRYRSSKGNDVSGPGKWRFARNAVESNGGLCNLRGIVSLRIYADVLGCYCFRITMSLHGSLAPTGSTRRLGCLL